MNQLVMILASFIYLWGLDDANALKTDEILFGLGGTYDGVVGIERNPDGTLRLWDQNADVTLEELVGGGVSAHNALTGLANDDHTQYYEAGRLTTKLGIPGGYSGLSGWDFIKHIPLQGDAGGSATLGDHISDPVMHRGIPSHLVTVSMPGQGGQFTTITDAISWVTAPSSTNQYVILITGGTYSESFNLEKPYVYLAGIGHPGSVVIQATKSTAGTPVYGDGVVNLKPGVASQTGLYNLTVKNLSTADNAPAVFVENGIARIERCDIIGGSERTLIINGGEYNVTDSFIKSGSEKNDTIWTGSTFGTFNGCVIETTSGERMLRIEGNDEHRFRFCQFNGSSEVSIAGGAAGYAKFFACTDINHVWLGDVEIEGTLTASGQLVNPTPTNFLTVSAESGRADYLTVQGAVDAAMSGDTVYIYPGTYNEQVTVDGKTVILRGASWGSHIAYTSDVNSYLGATIKIMNGSSVVLENLRISNPGVSQIGGVAVGAGGTYSPSVVIRNSKLDGYQDTVWNGNSDMFIYNCEVNGGYDTITHVESSTARTTRVQNCFISATDSTNHAPAWFYGAGNFYISNCLIYSAAGLIKVGNGATGNIYWSNNYVYGGGATTATPLILLGTWTTGKLNVHAGNVVNWNATYTTWSTLSAGSFRINGVEKFNSAGGATLSTMTATGDVAVDTNVLKVDTANDRVGIGVAAPIKRFDVRESVDGDAELLFLGNGQAAAAASLNETVQVRFSFGNTTGDPVGGARIVVGKEADFTSNGNRDSFVAVHTMLDNSESEKMRVTGAGNVGIGMTPDDKLDVNGTIQGTGYKSSDGSAGITQTITINDPLLTNSPHILVFKNGLLTDYTEATP